MIHAVDPQGTVCGATVVVVAGQYGPLACYGDQNDTEADEGAQIGDDIRLFAGQQQIAHGIWTGNMNVVRTPEEPVTPAAPLPTYLPLIYHGATVPETSAPESRGIARGLSSAPLWRRDCGRSLLPPVQLRPRASSEHMR